MYTPLEAAALRFCRAHKDRDLAVATLAKYQEDHGRCQNTPACYLHITKRHERCPICRDTEALYHDKRRANLERSAALDQLMQQYSRATDVAHTKGGD